MRFATAFLILSLFLASQNHAFAENDSDQIRAEVQKVLDQRKRVEDASWWQGLGPETPNVLISMYQESSRVYHKIMLLQAMAYFDTPAIGNFLKTQAQTQKNNTFRYSAIRSLGRSQGLKEEAFFASLMEHSDPQTRLVAAQTVRRMGTSRSSELVQSFLTRESDPSVVSAMKETEGKAGIVRRKK